MVSTGLLDTLDTGACPWGVVTNKPEQLTEPLMAALGLSQRAACVVSGDTLPVRKPDPAPVLLGCEIAGVDPGETIYIGDADRDIQAGRDAGTATIAAAFGYITEDGRSTRLGRRYPCRNAAGTGANRP